MRILGISAFYHDSAAALIEDGTINTDPWITHRTNFDDVVGDFDRLTKPETGVIKAVIEVAN